VWWEVAVHSLFVGFRARHFELFTAIPASGQLIGLNFKRSTFFIMTPIFTTLLQSAI